MHWIQCPVDFLPCPFLQAISKMQLNKWVNSITLKKKNKRNYTEKGDLDNKTKYLSKLLTEETSLVYITEEIICLWGKKQPSNASLARNKPKLTKEK